MPELSELAFNGVHIRGFGLFAVAAGCLLAALVWLLVTARLHRRNIARIPARIHVAGTRGKSTITRMIAAGLRAGGLRVLAKSTGSAPRLILPDGSEQDWPRRGPASVREQMKFFTRASRLDLDAVVLECMAIRPELVWASQQHLVGATTAVIANVRPDHFEELGSGADAMANSLRWVVPARGRLVVSSEAFTPELRAWADNRNCAVTVIDTALHAPHKTNRELAIAVCAAHGVPEGKAGAAIDGMTQDPGHFFVRDFTLEGGRFSFVNAFACNDVTSLAALWREAPAGTAQSIVLLNARPDRPLRSKAFLDWLAIGAAPVRVFVYGDPIAVHLGRRAGFGTDALMPLRSRHPQGILREIAVAVPGGGQIWGIGNFHGLGSALVDYLNQPEISF